MLHAYRLFILALSFSLPFSSLLGQETRFFMPQEIREAYEKGTRSYDGKPGPNYWQNFADYKIAVEVMPEERKISGSERIVFSNNSPDALNQLVIRLYQDAFREGNPRDNRVRPSDINEGVEISRMAINGEEVDLSNPRAARRSGTNMLVGLPEPLSSRETLTLDIDWALNIPETTIRMGAYDSTAFYLAYWYPQVGVYDDVFGWDDLAYDFSTEFYNNLGSFDVKITAPTNFTVLATGVLQNPGEILQEDHLSLYRKAQGSAETVSIITPEDLEAGISHKSGTWHYVADSVPDFSFCLSDHYCWDAAMQPVEDRNVFIHTYYTADIREDALPVTAFQQKSMKHFSEDMPGIPYPYPEFCTFIYGNTGGGMETPMMATNGGPGLGVTVHEMFHTYFPMYVRVNEKRFAWMDEGWADFNTSFVTNRFFEDNDAPIIGEFGLQISGTLGTYSDLPLITSTQFMDDSNYGYASYPLPAFIYAMLYEHLGDPLFKQCFREYIRRWAYKSPTPYDFFYTFEHVSGQDLSWLWKPWFFEFGNVDIAIDSYKNGKLTLTQKGRRPVPIMVEITYQDGTKVTEVYSPSLLNGKTHTFKLPRAKEIVSLNVNSTLPDGEIMDNFYPTLQDRFAQLELPTDMFGTYALNQVPFEIQVSKKEGILFFEILGAGFSSYLIPKEDNMYETLDGSLEVTFTVEDGKYTGLTLGGELVPFPLTGSKKE